MSNTEKQGLGKKPPVDQTLAEIWAICKNSTVSVDSFLEERHAERDREYAYRYPQTPDTRLAAHDGGLFTKQRNAI
ncbi:hypothetical protein FACS1894147_04340 [Spirochaetia bacterium]|nr:hypothetical protein FACS1894147_04340 [Spirochaetia bacterium]